MSRLGYSMSDSVGNLIFYTNGIKINNAQKQLMENGDSLNPGQVADDFRNSGYPIPNSIISVPHPNQAHQYYVFHNSITYASDIAGYGEHLYYSLVDMTANNGLGRVVMKNQILSSDSIGRGQLQAVKHGNGRDWWLIQYMATNSNGLQVFLVAGDSVVLQHQQYIGRVHVGAGWRGQSVFSPDGSVYVRYDDHDDINIYNFDRCSGYFSNALHIPIQDSTDILPQGYFVGVAISPNNRYLYAGSYHYLYQFDLQAVDIAASKDTVATWDGTWGQYYPAHFGALRLGADNKIYALPLRTKYLHTIEDPNIGGMGCNVQQRSVTLYNFSQTFLPNYPPYRTAALQGSGCDTLVIGTTRLAGKPAFEVQLYPNPTQQQLTVESTAMLSKSYRVQVYNALGQVVLVPNKQIAPNSLSLEVGQLPAGMYVLQLRDGEERATLTFVVIQ